NGGTIATNTFATPTAAANFAVTSPIYASYASANTYQVVGAGGAYTFGAATVGLTYSNIRFANLGKTFAQPSVRGQSITFNNAE
ncbi:porin, partial [Paraburkholderia sp. SIMBA_049]